MTSPLRTYPDWLPDTFARRIRRLRETRGLSYSELARRSGVHRGYVYLLERGQNPSLSVLARIAGAFGMTVSEMLDGVDMQEWLQI